MGLVIGRMDTPLASDKIRMLWNEFNPEVVVVLAGLLRRFLECVRRQHILDWMTVPLLVLSPLEGTDCLMSSSHEQELSSLLSGLICVHPVQSLKVKAAISTLSSHCHPDAEFLCRVRILAFHFNTYSLARLCNALTLFGGGNDRSVCQVC